MRAGERIAPLLLNFGAGSIYPNSGFPWKVNGAAETDPPPIWNCERLLAALIASRRAGALPIASGMPISLVLLDTHDAGLARLVDGHDLI
jgi:hypothetical protein